YSRTRASFPTRRSSDLRILSGLRESLGTVAATWSTQEARAFVAGPGEIDDQQTSPAIGYLFADNYADPMPETLTVAMADKLDARSEEHTSELQSRENLV